jgi:hypothetical protein
MKALLALLAASFAATALAVSASGANGYTPFVTDFPRSQPERYVPFVTDFPTTVPEAEPAGAGAHPTDGFDWRDAAFGLALVALAAASLPALRRRRTVSST